MKPRARELCRFVAALGLLLALALIAAAEAAAQIAVLRIEPAAEPLCQALESGLTAFDLRADPGYFMEAERRGLDPSGEAALSSLIPELELQLALVPLSADASSVAVEFRDGRTGASLGVTSIPLEGGAPDWSGLKMLEDEIRRRLPAQAAAAPAPGEDAAPVEDRSELADEADTLYLRAFGGAGMGMRDVSWPEAGETLSVETGAFLAFELGASFGLTLNRTTELGPELVYQSSLDHEAEEVHVAGPPDRIGIRAHRFEALLALGLRFGASGGFRITPALGYALRNLRPEVHHLLTPSYTLAGPLFRLTLRIPFGDSVALRLSPEVQYVLVGDDFEERGVEGSGFAFGGQAGIEVALDEQFTLELTFREAHALIPATLGDDAADVERFATARLVWQP